MLLAGTLQHLSSKTSWKMDKCRGNPAPQISNPTQAEWKRSACLHRPIQNKATAVMPCKEVMFFAALCTHTPLWFWSLRLEMCSCCSFKCCFQPSSMQAKHHGEIHLSEGAVGRILCGRKVLISKQKWRYCVHKVEVWPDRERGIQK